jgi:hypothetical protein
MQGDVVKCHRAVLIGKVNVFIANIPTEGWHTIYGKRVFPPSCLDRCIED